MDRSMNGVGIDALAYDNSNDVHEIEKLQYAPSISSLWCDNWKL